MTPNNPAGDAAPGGNGRGALRDDAGARRPLWARIALAFAFWTAIGVFFASQFAMLLPDPNAWSEGLRMSLPRWYAWGVLTPLIARTDRIFAAGRSRTARLLMHVPLGVVWTLVAIALRFAIRPLLHGSYPPSVYAFFVERFHWDVLVYGVIAGVIVARDYAARAHRRELEAARLSLRAAQLERGLTEARLQTLHSQLNPHFLFNALNAISAFMEREPRRARRLMAHLGDLLRSSLEHADRPEVTLREELAFVDDYLGIERARFEDRLTVVLDVDPSVLDALVPSFLLQPLVENAIRHGINARTRAGSVEVSAWRDGDVVRISVRDDGPGLPGGWNLRDGSGTGLRNLADRLQELYPDAHRFAVIGAPGGGTLVEVVVPYRHAGATVPEARSSEVGVS